MRNPRSIPMLIAVCLALSAPAALAGERGHHGFDRLDADGDGRITRAEMEERRSRHFERMDADGDGRITVAELEASVRQRAARRAQKMMRHMDADGDGAVTPGELGRKHGGMFDKADKDNDGAISAAEWKAAGNHMKRRHHKDKD